MRGAEASQGGWNAYMTGTGPLTGNHWEQSDNVLKYFVFENPNWDFRTFNYDKDVDVALKKLGKTMDAFDPDLSKFRQRGGKLLLYHGWNDASISPLNTINYYESVVSTLQGKQTRDGRRSRRTEVRPAVHGAGHAALRQRTRAELVRHADGARKLEQKKVRRRNGSIASHSTRGVQDRTRPLCVYPKVAKYTGSGSTDAARTLSAKLRKRRRTQALPFSLRPLASGSGL